MSYSTRQIRKGYVVPGPACLIGRPANETVCAYDVDFDEMPYSQRGSDQPTFRRPVLRMEIDLGEPVLVITVRGSWAYVCVKGFFGWTYVGYLKNDDMSS